MFMGFFDGLLTGLTGRTDHYSGQPGDDGNGLGDFLGALAGGFARGVAENSSNSGNMEIVVSEPMSDISLEEFEDIAGDENHVYNFAAENMGKAGCVITKFFQISPENGDKEDAAAVQYVQSHICSNYNICDNMAFLNIVDRKVADSSYLIYSHFSNNNGWLHYVYYMQC